MPNDAFSVAERFRVLVVDNCQDTTTSLTILFRRYGFDCIGVLNGASALGSVAEFDPQILLLDIAMPRMDGFEVVSRLRAVGDRRIIVAFTGYADSDTRSRALSGGFNAHIAKPATADELTKLFRDLLHRRNRENLK